MVVAVPRSSRVRGGSYSARAATAITIRSLPTWEGVSIWMFSPVFSPGPTTMGALPVTFITPVRTELNTGGTTEEMMQSSISWGLIWNRLSILLISAPYWSEVLMRSVAMRASKAIFPPLSMPPMTMLVLPMSIARSISSPVSLSFCSPGRRGADRVRGAALFRFR